MKKFLFFLFIILFILMFNITLLDILITIKNILAILLNGAIPIIIAIIAYFLKQWLSFKKSYRESLLKCKWIVQQNMSLLVFLKQNDINIDKKLLIDKLELIPPYLEYYSKFIDDVLRNNLISYNAHIIQLKVSINYDKQFLSRISTIQNSLFQSLSGQITLVDDVFKNPLSFFTLAYIINFIVNKYLKPNK